MSDVTILSNYSDDANIKQYIQYALAPKVFNDIPLNVLNTGSLGLINETMSQAMQDMAFTSAFYLNENFITKAVLPDSVYAEAAIFDLGYSYAIPSACNFILELKIQDLYDNATPNDADSSIMEFILDKDTKFNLSNGSVYSLDYDILIQYHKKKNKNEATTWNVQYINKDVSNRVAKNKGTYIMYRVSPVWLCLFVQASEYTREVHVVTNNMTNGLPNADTLIHCVDHICGFDVRYISQTRDEYLPADHILQINSNVKDNEPYIHYIMDDSQTIRFMFQLNGNRYFVPELNSSYEITVYTCHGDSANFTAFKDDEQPSVITNSNKYSNNANVTKAAFIISGSMGGTNIGTMETVRRETIEMYNTANVLSTDHDIDEWFKTFNFKNVLYPFFFKRRDDPWGRIWSGFLALKNSDNEIFKTNTLHGKIPYDVLYSNNDNTVTDNEIIIPPGWVWVYGENDYTVTPYIDSSTNNIIENADTVINIDEKYIFANPFGIRIQKEPFAIGYFNPWINEYISSTQVSVDLNLDDNIDDESKLYHATPILTNIKRTYKNNFYNLTTFISPTDSGWGDANEPFARYTRNNINPPVFTDEMWNYFKKPVDIYSSSIPMLPLTSDETALPFVPKNTYLCTGGLTQKTDGSGDWILDGLWIDDESSGEPKTVGLPMSGNNIILVGTDEIWGENGLWHGYEVYEAGDVEITTYPDLTPDEDSMSFTRYTDRNYYELRLGDEVQMGVIQEMSVTLASEYPGSKFAESSLYCLGTPFTNVYINFKYSDGTTKQVVIRNAAGVYTPYTPTYEDGIYKFNLANLSESGIILYAEMKPLPDSGAIDYYRIPFSLIPNNTAFMYVTSESLPVESNNMRVVLHAYLNGTETGFIEMQPVSNESDGTIRFETVMQPLTKMIDVDNIIKIASSEYGGGSWEPTTPGTSVSLDGTDTELKISIFFRSTDSGRPSDFAKIPSLQGFRLVDEYTLDDLSLVQEMKEMRSVVNFGESSKPTDNQKSLYSNMEKIDDYNPNVMNLYTVTKYAYNRMMNIVVPSGEFSLPFSSYQTLASTMIRTLNGYFSLYESDDYVGKSVPTPLQNTIDIGLQPIVDSEDGNDIDWESIWTVLYSYHDNLNSAFKSTNVNGGIEIQLVPFVEYSLMMSDEFEEFVPAFTQVHTAIEPVIFERLEGNHYLDCKLIATYGKPHSYTAGINQQLPKPVFWPDLNVQIEFDVKLYNQNLKTNTINELRTIVKEYFNRLTTIHTATDILSSNNNIYISHVIQQMESHANVEYMKFKGWYTNEKSVSNGNYMDANTQSIVQCWKKLEDFPKEELERFVPELFILEDDNIVINIL